MAEETPEALCKEFGLTADELQQYQELFDSVIGKQCSDSQLFEGISKLPKNTVEKEDIDYLQKTLGDGHISLRKFLIVVTYVDDDSDPERKLRNIFALYDMDNSGYLEKDEVKYLITKLAGFEVSDQQVELGMQKNDTNKDGKISFEEFRSMLGQ
mmetsp:Transcript_208/g.256  ORF Transcript_208/g.256 Transcript_208/m.256 type:complete len:155 (-) Transcript_208:24-488(-)|eukprot:CAMPEP_0206194002 /NCGR_PEP_ID=MMETSP0166-20121206/6924_1 /ASSEMBLY_ACC=CAM_ASM_000260 /TAXON_ID=95228 /ORGANISM="Vannella robusta, Strain DIVA3 518/3/11/1/6" /LENGTH=154 /DNA_ID=CAMNT_0053610865 /DNA_START=552 /DNA_END=1016 /DNA_ORIENTATION=+